MFRVEYTLTAWDDWKIDSVHSTLDDAIGALLMVGTELSKSSFATKARLTYNGQEVVSPIDVAQTLRKNGMLAKKSQKVRN